MPARRVVLGARLTAAVLVLGLALLGLFVLGRLIAHSMHEEWTTVKPEIALRNAVARRWDAATWGPMATTVVASHCWIDDVEQPCVQLSTTTGVRVTVTAPVTRPDAISVRARVPLAGWPLVLRLQRQIDADSPDRTMAPLPVPFQDLPPGARPLVRAVRESREDRTRWLNVGPTTLVMVQAQDQPAKPWEWSLVAPLNRLDQVLLVAAGAQDLAARARAGAPLSASDADALAQPSMPPTPPVPPVPPAARAPSRPAVPGVLR